MIHISLPAFATEIPSRRAIWARVNDSPSCSARANCNRHRSPYSSCAEIFITRVPLSNKLEFVKTTCGSGWASSRTTGNDKLKKFIGQSIRGHSKRYLTFLSTLQIRSLLGEGQEIEIRWKIISARNRNRYTRWLLQAFRQRRRAETSIAEQRPG